MASGELSDTLGRGGGFGANPGVCGDRFGRGAVRRRGAAVGGAGAMVGAVRAGALAVGMAQLPRVDGLRVAATLDEGLASVKGAAERYNR